MPRPLKIELTEEQIHELKDIRDHHAKPYLRERAAAILKINQGASGRSTARQGLIRPHWPDTIYDWVQRYQKQGIEGLKIKSGRGRKPAFFPSVRGQRNST